MTPVALLLIGFDRRDSRTDGAQGTSTLDLEHFFSIMNTAQKHSKICRKAHMHLTAHIAGQIVLQGLRLRTLNYYIKELQKNTLNNKKPTSSGAKTGSGAKTLALLIQQLLTLMIRSADILYSII